MSKLIDHITQASISRAVGIEELVGMWVSGARCSRCKRYVPSYSTCSVDNRPINCPDEYGCIYFSD